MRRMTRSGSCRVKWSGPSSWQSMLLVSMCQIVSREPGRFSARAIAIRRPPTGHRPRARTASPKGANCVMPAGSLPVSTLSDDEHDDAASAGALVWRIAYPSGRHSVGCRRRGRSVRRRPHVTGGVRPRERLAPADRAGQPELPIVLRDPPVAPTRRDQTAAQRRFGRQWHILLRKQLEPWARVHDSQAASSTRADPDALKPAADLWCHKRQRLLDLDRASTVDQSARMSASGVAHRGLGLEPFCLWTRRSARTRFLRCGAGATGPAISPVGPPRGP